MAIMTHQVHSFAFPATPSLPPCIEQQINHFETQSLNLQLWSDTIGAFASARPAILVKVWQMFQRYKLSFRTEQLAVFPPVGVLLPNSLRLEETLHEFLQLLSVLTIRPLGQIIFLIQNDLAYALYTTAKFTAGIVIILLASSVIRAYETTWMREMEHLGYSFSFRQRHGALLHAVFFQISQLFWTSLAIVFWTAHFTPQHLTPIYLASCASTAVIYFAHRFFLRGHLFIGNTQLLYPGWASTVFVIWLVLSAQENYRFGIIAIEFFQIWCLILVVITMSNTQKAAVWDNILEPMRRQNPLFSSLPPAAIKAIATHFGDNKHSLAPTFSREWLEKRFWMPPIGGKIAIKPDHRDKAQITLMCPGLTPEELLVELRRYRAQGVLSEHYIQQLTVQGRLPDEFKYAAMALIMSSPHPHQWKEVHYDAPWGRVSPLIHDGGNTAMDVNPLWNDVYGRTDFLHRIARVFEPNKSAIDAMSEVEQLNWISADTSRLDRYHFEQREEERFLLEAHAYQALALALHAKLGTAPSAIPAEIREKLSIRWQEFRHQLETLLGAHDLKHILDVPWFYEHSAPLWSSQGPRHEADWPLIHDKLELLEQARRKIPHLQKNAVLLLIQITRDIHDDLGLDNTLFTPPPKPNPPPSSWTRVLNSIPGFIKRAA